MQQFKIFSDMSGNFQNISGQFRNICENFMVYPLQNIICVIFSFGFNKI